MSNFRGWFIEESLDIKKIIRSRFWNPQQNSNWSMSRLEYKQVVQIPKVAMGRTIKKPELQR